MNNLVSVIVTCYNHEQFIEECLQSILHQSYQNIELLVFNDGSTDQSQKVIQRVLENSPFNRTEYYYHENKGVVATRNVALEKIKGDFFLFVDSDDYLELNFVEEMLKVAQEEVKDIVYTRLVNPNKHQVVIDAPDFSLEQLMISNYISATSLVRTAVLGEVRFDGRLNNLEDYDFFLNLVLTKGAKPYPCKTTFLNYRVLEHSISDHDNRIKYYSNYTYILNKYASLEPRLAEKALKINAQHILNDNMMANQIIKVYFQHNGEFSNDYSLDLPLKEKDSITFKVDQATTVLRIDLSEVPSYYKLVRLETASSQTTILPSGSNAIQVDDSFFFKQEDPQIFYDVSSFKEREFILTYETYNLYNIKDDDYIPRVLAGQLADLKKNTIYRDHYYRIIQQWKMRVRQISQELAQLQDQHNRVIGSRRWIIPTKIINFIRRNK